MRLQTGITPSKHISIRDGLSFHFEWGVRLEAAHNCEANFAGNSEAFERWAQHRISRATITLDALPQQSWRICKAGESICSSAEKIVILDNLFLRWIIYKDCQSHKFVHLESDSFLKTGEVKQVREFFSRNALFCSNSVDYISEVDFQGLAWFFLAVKFQFFKTMGKHLHQFSGIFFGDNFLLVIYCLKPWSHWFEVGISEWNINLKSFKCANVHDILAVFIGLVEAVG